MNQHVGSRGKRRTPIGAEPFSGGTAFRVWAPARSAVTLVVEQGGEHPLQHEDRGYFSAEVAGVGPGARYRFRLDGDQRLYPDPASRFQPEGPHGPSEVIDGGSFAWTDQQWPGSRLAGQVIYELHVGTFTPEGTFAAAIERLPHLATLGITLIEIMPVAEFPGEFGWGYDGVDLFAPDHAYGRPDDLRAFVDAAHAAGIGVILDVVYNHLGPDGNYIGAYSDTFFKRHSNEWGSAVNFDEAGSDGVRAFFVANAVFWITEYHFDGLRLDATQAMPDGSAEHILAELTRAARAAAGARAIVMIAENEPQDSRLVRAPDEGGYGIDAVWNDDLHHSAMVAMTGRRQAYYGDHAGTPQEFISAAKYGFLFQGQHYDWQRAPRGVPGLDLPPARFVTFIQNHDQVANTGRGGRVHFRTSPARIRAMTAYLLLSPGTPMIFQGQEFAASTPFLYFADHEADLHEPVWQGRRDFLAQFPSLADEKMAERIPNPSDADTFRRSKLRWSEVEEHHGAFDLHRDLIALRRSTSAFTAQRTGAVDGAVLGPEAFLLRFRQDESEDAVLLVNLGLDLTLRSIPDPLIAPPAGRGWSRVWSSEHPRYGGGGTPPIQTRQGWHLPGHAAIVFLARPADEIGPLPSLPVNPALPGI